MFFSCFSCFEKIIILDDFWPPQMSPKPQLFVYFDHLCFYVFLYFRSSHSSKTSKTPHTCGQNRGSHFLATFWKIMIFHVFSRHSFFEGPELTFFDFGRSQGPSKSTPTLQKWLCWVSENTILKKSCFFNKKSGFKKNMIFHHLWTLKNHNKIELLRVVILEHGCFFRRRILIFHQDHFGTTFGPLLDHFGRAF